ncbi:MAG: hypothetical protein DWQ01_04750 [Planctomycetota bacterium]|nr:MAG: hypothetical protein DWQ01_04750 [Planctomycetota bacterium]
MGLLPLLLLTASPSFQLPEPPPNVILILSDDQGTADLGAFGTEDVVTPHLDALADRGVRFTQFYAASSICSPSRASLLTGRYPHRAGVGGNVSPGGHGLPFTETTLAEWFQGHGFATALIGKWHLGTREDQNPLHHGFDRFFGHKQGCIDNYSHFFFWNGPNRHDLWRDHAEIWQEGEHFGELLVREAKAFLEQHRNRPFFLYLPFNSPHYPLQGTAKWRQHFAHLEPPRRDYLAFLATMDEQIGEILSELPRLGIQDQTVVVFQSDHGHSTEVRSFEGGGSAGPYRGAKFSLFEGGIRVPAIVSWPGHLPEGEIRDQAFHAIDWFPTLVDLAGLPLPPHPLDGISLRPWLDNQSLPGPNRPLFWKVGNQWAIRNGPWKLLGQPRDTDRRKLEGEDQSFLVHLTQDPGEQNNLATQHPDRVKAMTQAFRSWQRDVEKPQPKLLLLALDGVRADALRTAYTPHLDSLIANGTVSYDARGCGTSGDSAPNWGTLLSGLSPQEHGLVSNAALSGFEGPFPHFFKRLKHELPWLHSATFAKWRPFSEVLSPAADGSLRFPKPGSEPLPGGSEGDQIVAEQVAAYLQQENHENLVPGAVVVHLGQVDGAGHQFGYHHDVDAYRQAVEKLDASIGVILDALKQREGVKRGREDWLICATTDHGGYGLHGGEAGHSLTGDPIRDAMVQASWWILSGPSVSKGSPLGQPTLFDLVPTALAHFELETEAEEFIGNPLGFDPELAAKTSEAWFRFSSAHGLGAEAGLIRRDPSDVVRTGDRYLVWYTKIEQGAPNYPEGYAGEIWYAESRDEGHHWKELGRALGHGPKQAFDAHGVFTPNILQFQNRWFLYYTAVAADFLNQEVQACGRTTIAVAQADSPDGPWQRPAQPVLSSTWDLPHRFDSYRVDDACLVSSGDGIRLYYKGRCALRGSGGPKFTRMGLATAPHPLGPFQRWADGIPIQDSGHEVLVWTQNQSYWSLVSGHGPRGRSLRKSPSGLDFDAQITQYLKGPGLRAPGLFRPELSGREIPETGPRWGLHMSSYSGEPGLERFEFAWPPADQED